MISISNIVFLLIVTNLIAGVVLLYQYRTPLSSKPNPSFKFLEISNHKFEDPIIAYYILNKLDIFEPVDYTYLDDLATPSNTTSSYGYYFYGYTSDDNYCEKHRAYFIDHPEYVFYEKNVILDYLNTSLVRRKVIPSIGVDLVPNVTAAIPEKVRKSKSYDIPPNVNSFFVNGPMHVFREIGKNFACLTQTYNHIPGHSTLNRKDFVAESAIKYAKRYEKRSHCFNFDKFFPQTWTLYIKDQCESFFKHFNSPDYAKLKAERRIVYIRKIGSGAHKAKGVEPVDAAEEKSLRDLYENGALCGKQDKNYIVQHFVHNPLLLEGHKFDFRIYMMVASTNPMILYYHDGFLRLSLHKYDVNSDDKSVLLTNTDLSLETIKDAAQGTLFNGMNETELRNFQMWNFTRLHNYLYEHGHVRDRNWLDNYLRPEFRKAMIHLTRMSQHSFLQRSSIYEFFGVDFMLDDDLNLWFLECNTSPVLKGTSDEKERFLTKMLQDHFEIVIGLLRSRTKRLITFVNEITREIQREELTFEDFYIKDLYQRRRQFKDITRNRFEPEYEADPNNGFSKIIDENYDGVERYSNLISKDCL